MEICLDQVLDVVARMESRELDHFMDGLKEVLAKRDERTLLRRLGRKFSDLDWASWHALEEFEMREERSRRCAGICVV